MAKRTSKLTQSLRELGDIQVNDWQLPSFLNKEISELEFSRAIQRLGQIQVTDWDIKEVMPALKRLANRDVDVVELLKQAASYKVNDWDIRKTILRSRVSKTKLSKGELRAITEKLTRYLRFMIDKLVDEPQYASIITDEIAPQVLRFRIVLKQRDLSMLIGMNGFTANPIRRILKDTALHSGVYAILQIQSHEEATRTDGD